MITALNGIIASSIASVSYDADAQLFFNAESSAGVSLTLTEKNAVNQLVVDSKAAGIWTKMKAIYPLVGGTATSHKFNLKDSRDLDAAFRLVFNGGVTHSSNGILGNGTNGFANTFLNPSIVFPSKFASNGFYNRVAATNQGIYMGTQVGASNFFRIAIVSLNIRHFNRSTATGQTNNTVTNELGFSANSRTSNTLMTSIDNNGTFQTNTTNVISIYSSYNIPLLASNSSGAILGYSNAQFSFAYISDALTSSELTSLKNINQTFQTTLGRQV
jgi:hypothetical protein